MKKLYLPTHMQEHETITAFMQEIALVRCQSLLATTVLRLGKHDLTHSLLCCFVRTAS